MDNYELVIVGSGPAALAAAFYAQEKELNVLMVGEKFGGKASLTSSSDGISENQYLPSTEIVSVLLRRISHQPERILQDRVLEVRQDGGGFQVRTQGHGTVQARAVLIATGASPRQLQIPGLHHLAGQGLGSSITTFAQLVLGQRVAVIGMTPRTVRGVAELVATASAIYLIGKSDEALSQPIAKLAHQYPTITILTNAVVKAFTGNTVIEGLIIEQVGQTRVLPVERVFVDLGLVPNSEMVRGLGCTDTAGFVCIDDDNSTAIPGLYAAGDVTNARFGEQVLIAMGEGARAASLVVCVSSTFTMEIVRQSEWPADCEWSPSSAWSSILPSHFG